MIAARMLPVGGFDGNAVQVGPRVHWPAPNNLRLAVQHFMHAIDPNYEVNESYCSIAKFAYHYIKYQKLYTYLI